MKIIFSFSLLLISLITKAQVNENKFIVKVAPLIAVPVGDLKTTNGLELGGHINLEWLIAKKTRFIAQLGGGVLNGKTYDTQTGYSEKYPALNVAQLRIGSKYFFAFNKIYVEGLVGLGKLNTSTQSSTYGITYSPAIGFEFGDGNYYDIAIRYDNSKFKNFNIGTIGLSIGYHF